MKKVITSTEILSTSLAIFSMFFGAGNLMFPLKVGLISGDKYGWGMLGFLITGICLPLAGLLGIILFDGDYEAFFYRLGRMPGKILLMCCMFIIGPFIAMPRIVTLSYVMVGPFMPNIPLFLFSFLFLAATFWATYKENKIIDLLGYVISPLLLISLLIIIVKGIMTGTMVTTTSQSAWDMFFLNLRAGYQTLDLLGGIFFSAIIINLLKKYTPAGTDSKHYLAITCLKAGVLGTALLGLIYVGLGYLGAYFGHNAESINEGMLFSTISFRVFYAHGAAVIAMAVLMACYSTIIALAAVFAECFQKHIMHYRITFIQSLLATLFITALISNVGLDNILKYSLPIIDIGYPVIIMLTLCNIAYKIWGMRAIKIPVFVTFLLSLTSYYESLTAKKYPVKNEACPTDVEV